MPRGSNLNQQGFLIGVVVALLILLIWAANLFSSLRLRLNDVYFTPAGGSGQITIVAVDDASVTELGYRPGEMPRAVYARLLNQLSATGARVVAFDILFDIPTPDDDLLAKAIREARSGLHRTRIVLAAAGEGRTSEIHGEQILGFVSDLMPAPPLKAAADYMGYTNVIPDGDSRIRRQPSLVRAGNQGGYSFAVAVYLAYLRIPPNAVSQILVSRENLLEITRERRIPVDELGLWRQNYAGPPTSAEQQTFRVVPLHTALSIDADDKSFQDKVVIVGIMNSVGATEQHVVPAAVDGQLMAGLEVQANAIETLLQNKVLREQQPWSQAAAIIVFSIGAAVFYSHLRWYWALVAAGVLVTGWWLFCFVQFTTRYEVVNLFDSSLAVVLPALGAIGVTLSREIRQRQQAEFLLDSVLAASNQRLELERILEIIESDVHRLNSGTAGAILIGEENADTPDVSHAWGLSGAELSKAQELGKQARREQRMIVKGRYTAIPVLQNRRAFASITVQEPIDRALDESQRRQIAEYARNVAPVLDNALLFFQVQRQKTVLEAILTASPAGIVVLSQELKILRSNPKLLEILRQDSPSVQGKGFLSSLTSAQLDAETCGRLHAEFLRHSAFRQEIKLDERTFMLDAAPLAGPGEWVVVLNDITALADLSRLKTFMIRMGSHELKNPLSRILVYGDLLLNYEADPSLSDQSRQFISYMMRSADQMKQIIADILDLELTRIGKTEKEPVDMRAVVSEVVAQIQADATARFQNLTLQAEAAPLHVAGNHRQLALMLTNLVANAVKYTPEGGKIQVRLRASPDQALRIEVEDNGYGIPTSAQEKLFTEFYRVRTEATASIPGTGLGLSLVVKAVVDLHQGRVWLESQEGVGTTFFVELPALVD